jgi:hypothetical protein
MNQPPVRALSHANLFIEAFGRLSMKSDPVGLVNAEDEDLYSVFRARSTLMSWYGADWSTQRPMAWHMHEAEITLDPDKPSPDTSRIAYVQVGLEPYAAEIVLRLPALIQCFHDALRRFADVDLSAIQITASSLVSHSSSCLRDLVPSRNWFNTVVDTRVPANIAFDQESFGDHPETRLFTALQGNLGPGFFFGALANAPKSHRIVVPGETPYVRSTGASDVALPVTLPEWTPSAIGFVLAAIVDLVLTTSPDRESVMVRITRIN